MVMPPAVMIPVRREERAQGTLPAVRRLAELVMPGVIVGSEPMNDALRIGSCGLTRAIRYGCGESVLAGFPGCSCGGGGRAGRRLVFRRVLLLLRLRCLRWVGVGLRSTDEQCD